nr:hypothetical protein [Tanacetum cinerariifolium]
MVSHASSPLNSLRFPFAVKSSGWKSDVKNTQEALTIIENKSKEQELKTITELVEIPSSQSTPLVPPQETPPLIDIVDSLCDKFPIENNSFSGNPTPSSNFMVESFSPLPTPCGDSDSLIEEINTILSHFNDSLPDYKTFCFDIEEKSSGSTTSHSNHSLPEYESFDFNVDHIKEKNSGSTTSHSNLSLPECGSFHFDLSIDPFPPANRSDSQHEEFADGLAHIISPPEYDRFYFNIEPDLGELTILCEENIYEDSTKELTSPELNDFPIFLSDCDSTFSEEFSEIDRLVLFPFRNKDKVFDPGIFTINGVHSKIFSILLLDDFFYSIR